MEWFWVITGTIMLVPAIAIILIKPYETKNKELEQIEART